MEDIKVGSWVVDQSGDYAQVVKINYFNENSDSMNEQFIAWLADNHPDMFKQFRENYKIEPDDSDEIVGQWISNRNPDMSKRGFIGAEREDIVGVYPTEEVAQIHASVISENLS